MEMTNENPAELGFDVPALDAAWGMLVRAAEAHMFGGAVALIARYGKIALLRATGWAVREPVDQRTPVTTDTIFDLASLTKVTATTPSILQLVAEHRLGLDQPVGEILSAFGTEGAKREVTIRRLLSHTAGLIDWRPFYFKANDPEAMIRLFATDQPVRTPGEEVVYSDPGFIMLGEVVRAITGQSVAGYAAEHIFQPLGMTDTMFTPPRALRRRIAATEIGNPFEKAKDDGYGVAYPHWRSGLIRGEVHDGNAWYGLHGIAGHAGLFSTARDLARYGQCWLNGGALGDVRLLPEEIVAAATTEQPPAGSGRGLGWRLGPGEDAELDDSGRGVGSQGYGHTGFTGTSIWIDPEADLVMVLLTNRVHPTVKTDYMPVRSAFTAAVVAAAQEGATAGRQ